MKSLTFGFCFRVLERYAAMLPCASLVTNYRRRQNVERISQTLSAISTRATFFGVPDFDVICDQLLKRTATWNLNISRHTGNGFLHTFALLFFTLLSLLRFSWTLFSVPRGGWVGAGAGPGFRTPTIGFATFTKL